MFFHSFFFSFSSFNITSAISSLSPSLQLILCFYSREVPVKRWQCSRKLGYCKHRYSSTLHSSLNKGKLLIECETKSVPFIHSLILFTAVISLTILEDLQRVAWRKGRTSRRSTRRSYYPCEYPRECHSWRPGKPQAMSNSLPEHLLTYRLVSSIATNL